MRFLIVEDHVSMADQLARGFSDRGYSAKLVGNAEEGLFEAQEIDYTLAVVDLGLPGMSGLELIKHLRKSGSQLPVIVLTARTDVETIVQAMEAGADSIYCAMSPRVVEVLAREGVPVIAHVGLAPPKATWVGGMRAVGGTPQQALQVYRETKEFEAAGAFAVEMEVVPARLAAEITRRVSLLTISLGSGAECDVQYLFSADLLGENRGHIPRHAKVYRNFAAERDRLQQERIAAYREYIEDVTSGAFPGAGHMVGISDEAFESFLEGASKLG